MKALGSARFLILSAAMLIALATFAPQRAEARRGIGIGFGIGAAVIGGAIINEAARAPRVRAAPAPRVYREPREPKARKVVVPVERPEKYEKVEKPSRKARRGKQREEQVDTAKVPAPAPSNAPPQARGPDAPAGSPKESGSLTPTSSQPLPGQQDSSGKFGPHGF